jgi:hypothetical protein
MRFFSNSSAVSQMSKKFFTAVIGGLLIAGFFIFMFANQNVVNVPNRDLGSLSTFADVNSSPRSYTEDAASRTCAQVNLKKYSIQIESEFIINRLRNWNNIFQTDSGNQGVRFEIDEKGQAAFLLPIREDQKIDGIIFKKETIRLGTENRFSVVVTLTNKVHVKAQLNGELQTKSFPYSEIGCENPISGGGYDATRTLEGISRTEISLVQVSDNEKFGISYMTQKSFSIVLLTLLFVTLLIVLTRRDDIKHFNSDHESS